MMIPKPQNYTTCKRAHEHTQHITHNDDGFKGTLGIIALLVMKVSSSSLTLITRNS